MLGDEGIPGADRTPAPITGGGSGIGLAGAEELVRAGARVVISGRTQKTNREAERKLRALGDAEALHLEVSDRKAVAAAAADIEKRHGRIDILVTSAGTTSAATGAISTT